LHGSTAAQFSLRMSIENDIVETQTDACREKGESGDVPRHPRQRVIKRMKLQNLKAVTGHFSYCKAANTCRTGLIFRNLFFCQHWFIRIQMPVIFIFFNTRNYTLGERHTPNQTDSGVTFSRSCDQGKITKKTRNIYIDV